MDVLGESETVAVPGSGPQATDTFGKWRLERAQNHQLPYVLLGLVYFSKYCEHKFCLINKTTSFINKTTSSRSRFPAYTNTVMPPFNLHENSHDKFNVQT